jgi:CP family cyanate transporter-like MFS transporter
VQTPTASGRTATSATAVIIAIVLVAFNLRASIAAVSPLLPDIRTDLGLSRTAAGLLTTLPVLCFSALAVASAALGRRLGNDRAIVLAMVVLAAACALRLLPGAAWFFAGTLVLGAAIAVGNVLTPTLVKQHLAGRSTHLVGVTTGLYTAALIGGAAVASAISAPLADTGAGWRGALLVWAAPALLAAIAWSILVRRPAGVGVPVEGNEQQNVQPGTSDGVREDERVRPTLTRSWVTWALAVFMGTQSLAYFAVLAWLPALLRDDGVDAQQAGLALSLFNLLGIATALVTPTLAGRMTDQRALALSVCGLWAIGVVGLLVDPGLYLVWSVFAGLAQGAAISLALALIVLRARTPDVARQLSGRVQSVGYLIGAVGPFALGALRDATQGWTASLVALLVAVTAMAIGAWGAGQNKVVG